MKPKTVFIGLDGATFDLLDPLMDIDAMPFLKSFLDAGARAKLRTIVPPLTPPAWTSLLTGRSPGHHGVFDFFQLDGPGSKQIRLTTSRDVLCPTVAEIANQHQMKATVLNFPAQFPPRPIDGTVIAGWMPWRQMRLGCHPKDLYDRLKEMPGFDPRQLMMDMAQEASATEGAEEVDFQEWAETHAVREENWLMVLRYLEETDPSPLTALLLDGPDKIQHLCWRFLDPRNVDTLDAKELAIRESSIDYYRRLDSVLSEVSDLCGPDTTIVMASDHGFGDTTEVFHINSWLAQNGYLTWNETAFAAENSTGILGMHRLSKHTAWVDWSRTVAYAATPTSNGLHIVRADQNEGMGVTEEDYSDFREALIRDLLAFRDPITNGQIVVEAQTREEIFAGEAMDFAPDLTLTLRDGGMVSILPSEEMVKPREQPAGTHRPLGIFAARGPGILPGTILPELSILDVAPLLLYSLQLALPQALEGRVPLEIFDPEFRSRQKVKYAVAQEGDSPAKPPVEEDDSQIAYDEEAEAAIASRLRALGYIE